MESRLAWLFLLVGVIAMACGLIAANAIVFGLGLFFTVIGGADIAERLVDDRSEA